MGQANWNMGRTAKAPQPKPITIKLRIAAEYLDIAYDTLWKMVAREVFTTIRAQGRGPGKRVYVYADEIELYATTRDEMAVRNLRAEKGRLPKERGR